MGKKSRRPPKLNAASSAGKTEIGSAENDCYYCDVIRKNSALRFNKRVLGVVPFADEKIEPLWESVCAQHLKEVLSIKADLLSQPSWAGHYENYAYLHILTSLRGLVKPSHMERPAPHVLKAALEAGIADALCDAIYRYPTTREILWRCFTLLVELLLPGYTKNPENVTNVLCKATEFFLACGGFDDQSLEIFVTTWDGLLKIGYIPTDITPILKCAYFGAREPDAGQFCVGKQPVKCSHSAAASIIANVLTMPHDIIDFKKVLNLFLAAGGLSIFDVLLSIPHPPNYLLDLATIVEMCQQRIGIFGFGLEEKIMNTVPRSMYFQSIHFLRQFFLTPENPENLTRFEKNAMEARAHLSLFVGRMSVYPGFRLSGLNFRECVGDILSNCPIQTYRDVFLIGSMLEAAITHLLSHWQTRSKKATKPPSRTAKHTNSEYLPPGISRWAKAISAKSLCRILPQITAICKDDPDSDSEIATVQKCLQFVVVAAGILATFSQRYAASLIRARIGSHVASYFLSLGNTPTTLPRPLLQPVAMFFSLVYGTAHAKNVGRVTYEQLYLCGDKDVTALLELGWSVYVQGGFEVKSPEERMQPQDWAFLSDWMKQRLKKRKPLLPKREFRSPAKGNPKSSLESHRECSFCGSLGTEGNRLKHCQACKSVWYCGRVCQKGDWAVHRESCRVENERGTGRTKTRGPNF